MYPLDSVLSLCTVHISDVPSGQCSDSVHTKHFRCTLWTVFCLCAQYTLLTHPLDKVLSLCTVHISDAQQCDISLSIRLSRSVPIWFVLFALLTCAVTVLQTVPVHVETAVLFLNNVPNRKYSAHIVLECGMT